MISVIEFFRTGTILNNWFVRGILVGVALLIATEIMRILRNQKVRQENFYVFRRAAKLRRDDYEVLLGQEHPPPYLLRELHGSILENQIMEQVGPGLRLLLTGKAGIGKTRMGIWWARRFKRYSLALPKREKVHSLELPRKSFFFKPKVILFFDDLQDFSSAGTRLPYLFSSAARQSRDLKVIATCRTEELGKIPEEDMKLFTRIQIPEWTDQEGRRLASMIGHQEAYRRYFDGTPASIVMNLYKRRQYYIDLVNKKSPGRLILESLKLLFVAGIHSKLKPANATLVKEISERVFVYQGIWQLDVEELEREEFVKRVGTGIRCLDKYLIEVVRDPPNWSPEEIPKYLDDLYKILIQGDHTAELFFLGGNLYDIGFFERAIDVFTAYLERNPNDAAAYNNRGIAYYEKGKYDLVIKDCTEAIRIDPNNAAAYNNRGNAYGKKKKYDLAIKDYTEAIRIDPDYTIAYCNRGIAHAKKKKYDLAIKDYTEAIRIDPNDAATYSNRGNAYAEKKKYDLAIKDYTEAIRIDPNDAAAYHNRGIAYYEKGKYDLAIKDYTDAIRIDPNDAATYSNRGNAYAKKKKYDLAFKDYTEAIRIDPNDATTYSNRGATYAKKKKYDLAFKDCTEAIRIDRNNALAYTNRGAVYSQKGKYDLAVKDYTEAIRIDRNNALAYTNRGAAYYEKGKYDLAVKDYTEAIRIDPNRAVEIAHIGLHRLTTGSPETGIFCLKDVLGYEGEISDSPEFRRHFMAQLNSLVKRILRKQNRENC